MAHGWEIWEGKGEGYKVGKETVTTRENNPKLNLQVHMLQVLD